MVLKSERMSEFACQKRVHYSVYQTYMDNIGSCSMSECVYHGSVIRETHIKGCYSAHVREPRVYQIVTHCNPFGHLRHS